MTEEEARALMERSARNRAERGKPILPKNGGAYQAEIERRWAEAETRGEVMALEIPPEKKRRSKYGNQRVEVDGIRFDSKHEATVYQELMARVRSGELKCVMRQVRFDLGGGPNASGDSRYAYYADFVTIDRENRVSVYDAKSEATRKNRTYINKRKQVLAEWGIEIREV